MSHKPTGPTNQNLVKLIAELRKTKKNNLRLVARHLEKPKRLKSGVTLEKINRISNDGEAIFVPGKVLATGELAKKLDIYAWRFSKGAEEKIKKAGGSCKKLENIIKDKADGRIII
jgi:ribosomal protein L18E